MHHLYHSIFLI